MDENGKPIINPLLKDRNGKSGCLDEISLSDFSKWFSPKFVSQLKYLYVCGTSGEPTLAKDCLEILAYLRFNNPHMFLSIHTNGGVKPKVWWQKLAKLRVKVIFGIDGLEDTHALYRINTNWRNIIESAHTFITAGGDAEWQMLVFKHNEHQVDKCRKLAKTLGFNSFHIQHTTRFSQRGQKVEPVYNPKGDITHYLEASSVSEKNFDKIKSVFRTDTSVKQIIGCSAKKNFEIYVAGNGDVLPCCHMESCFFGYFDDAEDYKNKIDSIKPNLYRQTLNEIFESQYFRKIESTWKKDPLLVCSNTCSKTSGTWSEATLSQSEGINF
jgi:MoaA/NifB/PqqE/SkfB family radical SAM enzyme